MDSRTKAISFSALAGLVVGLLLGFLPEHLRNSNQQDRIATLTQETSSIQLRLNQNENELALSKFTVRAGLVSSQAEANNYSVASASASSLFTDLRNYVNSASSGPAKQQIEEVLTARDQTIAGLAQANPAVRPVLQQIFMKLENVSTSASQATGGGLR